MGGPLEGVKVIDLSRLAPGPYCSLLLADLGAAVTRVDGPGAQVVPGDIFGRNKRSIGLNLKVPEAREVLHRLCADADVLLEGFRPGVMARLGASYETISRINPRIVYCSLTGYGQTGPLSQEAGHDINYISIAGVLGQIGLPGLRPIPPLNLVADYAGGGLMAAFGIVCALYERDRSGRGQFIDAAMIDGSASLMTQHFAWRGRLSEPGKGMLGGGAPFYRAYRCKDDGYVSVGAIEPQFFRAFWEGLEIGPLPEQNDTAAWPEQHERIERRFLERTRDEWVEHFAGKDACVTPVLDFDETGAHPHNVARQAFVHGPEREGHVSPAPRFSRTPGSVRSEGPALGQHTATVLSEAGYSDEEIRKLRTTGAVE
jgi:alpha-methylacyl-CoA racemase